MQLYIPRDIFSNPQPPQIFLCDTAKKRLGALHTYDEKLIGKWNTYSELSFSIDRQYVDVLTGESCVDPLFDKVEGLRNVEVEGIGFFVIQDPNTTYADKDSKSVTAFSLEYNTASKYLENFYINTGEEDSKEVIYLSSIYGDGYSIDTPYTLSTEAFDAYESYYIRDYTDADSYTYQQESISNATVYATYDGSTVAKTLYVKKYPNVRFYWPTKPQLSLLNLIFAKIPEWSIGNVDAALWRKERKFSEERVAVYDFLTNTVAATIKCVVEFNTITSTVNFYEEAEDGITEDNTIQTMWESDVYISRENLASECNISYSTDEIKTKLKVSGADGLNLREVNLGKNYIMNLDYYHNLDWMEQDLFEAYDDYLDAVELYTPQYTDAMQNWVASYNQWNDLMNAVPAENDVLLIGDVFNKLYCIYSPIDNAHLSTTLTDSNIDTIVDTLYSDEACTIPISKTGLSDNQMFSVQGYAYYFSTANQNFRCDRNLVPENVATLVKKLNIYHDDDDLDASETDNILLKLKNSANDIATLRVYDPKTLASSTYNPEIQYYTRSLDISGDYVFTRIHPTQLQYTEYMNAGTNIYTNNYRIQLLTVRAASGMTELPSTYTLTQWVNGDLITDEIRSPLYSVKGFKISYIGTMGAYLCLAKDEVQDIVEANRVTHRPTEYLKSFGVNLLKSKQKTYTTIFQAQIEEMFAQEKYQCVVSDNQPEGVYPNGTRWFDSANNTLKVYNLSTYTWVVDNYTVSNEDAKNYENYQRYLENFYKLQAVQEVLNEKEKEATYCLKGYVVSSRYVDMSNYEAGSGYTQSLEGDLHRAAQEHFKNYSITRVSLDSTLPLYTFTTSAYPTKTFAVYLNGKTPYVAYASSQGVWQATMNNLSKLTELERFFTDEQYTRLSPFIREDEYSNDNMLFNGYESEEERLSIYNDLLEDATKELNKIAQPSLEFSMNMANILALPEFEPILNRFKLGNFVRIELREGLVKRARLLEVSLSFSDLSDFSCQFGNLVTKLSEIDKHADLMKQAISAGKQVATAASDWQKGADKANKLEEEIAGGLANSVIEIGKTSNQSIVWDEHGIWGRKIVDGTTDQFEPEQFRISNNKIIFSNDNFLTSKAVFGKYIINGEERWGPLSEYVTAGYIEGSQIVGGSLRIGQEGGPQFIVSEDGSVQILAGDGSSAYASSSDVEMLQDARRFHISLEYNGSTVFSEPGSSIIIEAHIYSWDEEIHPNGATYSWIRSSRVNDTEWNAAHANQNSSTLVITNADVEGNAQFSCEVNFND